MVFCPFARYSQTMQRHTRKSFVKYTNKHPLFPLSHIISSPKVIKIVSFHPSHNMYTLQSMVPLLSLTH